MAMKIKGIYKSFKFISQIFVVKEREMEIGYPTDVQHVAHIGGDSPSNSISTARPSWMNEVRTSPNFATSFGNTGEATGTNQLSFTTWSNQDMDEAVRSKPTSSINNLSSDHHNTSKKNKTRKTKSSTSSSSSSATRSRAPKSRLKFSEATPTIQI